MTINVAAQNYELVVKVGAEIANAVSPATYVLTPVGVTAVIMATSHGCLTMAPVIY